jgi:K+-sensing histidine kinase KdpD
MTYIYIQWHYLLFFVVILSVGVLFILKYRIERRKLLEVKLASNVRAQLLTIMVHDLKAPMNMYIDLTLNLAHLIQNKQWNDLEKVATEIERTSYALNLTMTNMLEWSLQQQNKITPVYEAVVVVEMFKEMLPVYERIGLLKKVSIRVINNTTETILTDRNLLLQILRNLLDNGIKFSPNGGTIFLTVAQLTQGMLTIKCSNEVESDVQECLKKIEISYNHHIPLTRTGLGIKFIMGAVGLLNGTVDWKADEDTRCLITEVQIPIPDHCSSSY